MCGILLAGICHQPRTGQQAAGRHPGMPASAPPAWRFQVVPTILATTGGAVLLDDGQGLVVVVQYRLSPHQ